MQCWRLLAQPHSRQQLLVQELLVLVIVLRASHVRPLHVLIWLPLQVIGSTLRFGLVAALGCFATGLLCLPSLASDDLRETCAELCSGIGHSLSGYAGVSCGIRCCAPAPSGLSAASAACCLSIMLSSVVQLLCSTLEGLEDDQLPLVL